MAYRCLLIALICCFITSKGSGQASQPKILLPIGHKENIKCLDISKSCRLIATAADKTIIIWDSKTGVPLQKIKTGDYVQQVLFTDSDSELLVATSLDATGYLSNVHFAQYNLKTAKFSPTIPLYGSDAIGLLANGTGLLFQVARPVVAMAGMTSYAKANQLVLWDIKRWKLVGGYYYAGGAMPEFKFFPLSDSMYFATVANERGEGSKVYDGDTNYVLHIWHVRKSVYAERLSSETYGQQAPGPIASASIGSNITAVTASEYDPLFAAASNQGVRLWNYRLDKESNHPVITAAFSMDSVKGQIKYMEFSKRKSLLVYSIEGAESFITVLDLPNQRVISRMCIGDAGSAPLIKLAANGEYYVVASKTYNAIVSTGGVALKQLKDRLSPTFIGYFSANNRYVISHNNNPYLDAHRRYADSVSHIGALIMQKTMKSAMPSLSEGQLDSIFHVYKSVSGGDTGKLNGRRNMRIWDLFKGNVFSHPVDSIVFTNDSVSADNLYAVHGDYTPTGARLVFGKAMREMEDSARSLYTRNPAGLESVLLLNKVLGKFNQMLNANESVLNRMYGPELKLVNRLSKDTFRLISIDSTDWIILCRDGYYMSSINGAKALSYLWNHQVYLFNQFDLQYNRPDIILNRIGLADSSIISSYRKAYEKRLKRMGFEPGSFDKQRQFNVPKIEIRNSSDLPVSATNRKMHLEVDARDSLYLLDRINIWINGVAIYGMNGINLRPKRLHRFHHSLPVELSVGMNKIEVSVLNEKGAESYREQVNINYVPVSKPDSKTYFIGIGASIYEDSLHNLDYAAKDIRDLSTLIKARYPDAVIDTLIDMQVTRTNVLALKQRLRATSIEDKVIVSLSGHGLLDRKLDFYFATHDIDFSRPWERGVPYDELEGLLDSIPARKKLLLIDACHSGEIDKEVPLHNANTPEENNMDKQVRIIYEGKKGMIVSNSDIGLQNSFELMQQLFANLSRGTGAEVISAAAGKGYAFENGQWNNGVFTYCVKSGLQNKAADRNLDGRISVSELRNYVATQVDQLTGGKQKPTARRENIESDWIVW